MLSFNSHLLELCRRPSQSLYKSVIICVGSESVKFHITFVHRIESSMERKFYGAKVPHIHHCIAVFAVVIGLYVGVLSVPEFCNDCFICSDDMERSNGCHQQRESNCCRFEVFAHVKSNV